MAAQTPLMYKSIFRFRWKMKTECSYRIFHFPFRVERKNNVGRRTPESPVQFRLGSSSAIWTGLYSAACLDRVWSAPDAEIIELVTSSAVADNPTSLGATVTGMPILGSDPKNRRATGHYCARRRRFLDRAWPDTCPPVPSLPALGPWAPPAERGPSLESIYRVSLTVDLCEG